MILDILKYPDKRLRMVAKEVDIVSTEIKQQLKTCLKRCMMPLVLV